MPVPPAASPSPPNASGPDAAADGWVTARTAPGGFRTALAARGHAFAADEPREAGGADAAPTPYELLLAAVAACTAMTVRMYADRKGWPLGDVVVRLRPGGAHAADCDRCEASPVGPKTVEREVEFLDGPGGPLTDEQRARLHYIADRCPVKQVLERGLRVGGGTPGA